MSGFWITICGAVITFIGGVVTIYGGYVSSNETSKLIRNEHSETRDVSGQIKDEIATKIEDLEVVSKEQKYKSYKSSFKEKFKPHIKTFILNYHGYQDLLQLMKSRNTYSLNDNEIKHQYNNFKIEEDLIDRYLENFYTFIHGNGQSSSARKEALDFYYELKSFVDSSDTYNGDDSTLPLASFVATVYKVSLKREDLLLADDFVNYRTEWNAWNYLVSNAYFYRIIEEALLFSDAINERTGFFVFSSGVTLNTFTGGVLRGRSDDPVVQTHRELFDQYHK